MLHGIGDAFGQDEIDLGRELARDEPVFRKALEDCDRALRAHVAWSLIELI